MRKRRRRKQQYSFRNVIFQAIREYDGPELGPLQKLHLAWWLARDQDAYDICEDHCLAVMADHGEALEVDAQGNLPLFDLDKFERLLQILIEYLPTLIAIFKDLFPAVKSYFVASGLGDEQADAAATAVISAITAQAILDACSLCEKVPAGPEQTELSVKLSELYAQVSAG